ncbi:MAG: hypothetical protein PHV85_00220 [Desulfovibrionaceae bacterium]|nr:hypothetical protein [Desulfovibrionaceae bacterium]
MSDYICPLRTARAGRDVPCTERCMWRALAETDAQYANRCEVAEERGEPRPERMPACALAVAAMEVMFNVPGPRPESPAETGRGGMYGQ